MSVAHRKVTSGATVASWCVASTAAIAAMMSLCVPFPLANHAVGADEAPPDRLPELRPFLEVFRSAPQFTVAATPASWASAVGMQTGYLARNDDPQPLPGVVLIGDGVSREFAERSAREFAEIGYVALLLAAEPEAASAARSLAIGSVAGDAPVAAARREQALARMSAAVRWLIARDDVLPDQLGVIGWSGGGRWALELAAAERMQACVLCDAELPLRLDRPLRYRLRGAALLVVAGTAGATDSDEVERAAFTESLSAAGVAHRLLEFQSASGGFLDTGRQDRFDFPAADRAWFEIYEFLGKHVEDAAIHRRLAAGAAASSPPPARHASIADIMQAVNSPSGLRGQLWQSLQNEPLDMAVWKQAHARAALLVESAELLSRFEPPQGSHAGWRRQVAGYRDAAIELADAVGEQSPTAARAAFARLTSRCAACHLAHR